MIITRVAPLSCAKVAGLLYLILGFIFGAIVSLIAVMGVLVSSRDEGALVGGLFGVGAVVLLPIVYGCLGFVMTLLVTSLFNVVVGITGGVEVDTR